MDALNRAEPSLREQFTKRVLLIGRHDYWPGYTPEVIKALDYDLWPVLALGCDQITEQHAQENAELRRMQARSRRGR